MYRLVKRGSVQLITCIRQQGAHQGLQPGPASFIPRASYSLAAEFIKALGDRSPFTNAPFRTTVMDPGEHTLKHEGLFYTIPDKEYRRWCEYSHSKEMVSLMTAFNEFSFMVRKPGLELIHYLKHADYSLPAIRYMLYGRQGCGKSTTLAQVMHFCGMRDWLVAHVCFGSAYCRRGRDPQPSSYKPPRVDLPLHASAFLKQFVRTNEALIKKLDLRVAHRYVWNKRESTEVGDRLMDVLNMGIDRNNYATDCVGALLKELKHYGSSGQCKVLFAVDGVNGFWAGSKVRMDHKAVPTEDLALVHNMKKMLRNDWSGGAVVCTVDKSNNDLDYRESDLPKYLLTKEAFELFDPFLPLHVDSYSDKEMHSVLEYLCDRKWIQDEKGYTQEGRNEITFLSSKNPYQVISVTKGW